MKFLKEIYWKRKFFKAIHTDNLNLLRKAIENGADVNAVDELGYTGLHLATMLDKTKVSLALMAAGANVNAVDANGNTPLYFTADRNNYELTLALIAEGANVDVENVNGNTPLHRAVDSNNIELTKAIIDSIKLTPDLIRFGINEDLIKGMTSNKGFQFYKKLLEMSNKLNVINPNNPKLVQDLIILAKAYDDVINRNNPKLVRALIAAKANVNAKNVDGDTPFHIAGRFENIELAKTLIGAGADLFAENRNGQKLSDKEFIRNMAHVLEGERLEKFHESNPSATLAILLQKMYNVDTAQNQNVVEESQKERLEEMTTPIIQRKDNLPRRNSANQRKEDRSNSPERRILR